MSVTNKINSTLISGSSTADKIYNYSSYVTIEGNAGDDYIVSFDSVSSDSSTYGEHVSISGGSGNDSIYSWSPRTLMLGNDGADYLYSGSEYSTVHAGDGNDEIVNYGQYGLIYGGFGNDYINNRNIGDHSTIIGAEGDDTITLGSASDHNLIAYSAKENHGNDVIYGFNSDDTLGIYEGSYSESISGNDLVLKAGNGSIVLKDRAGQTNNIIGTVTLSSGEVVETTTEVATTTDYVDTSQKTQDTTIVQNNYYTIVSGDVISTGGGNITNITGNDNIVGDNNIVKSGNTWTYSGGNKVINNYKQGEVIELASDYQGIDFNGSSFYVKSSSGSLEIQNSQDKFIGYSAGSTQVAAYSYMASGGGTVDGRGKSQAEIMIGGNNANNQMYAGSGGSSLWGGSGGNDSLIGGDGYDEFFYITGDGNDTISGAGDNDVVNLAGISLSQISYASVSYSAIDIGFTDGGSLKLNGTSATGFRLEGVTYTANRSTGAWSTK